MGVIARIFDIFYVTDADTSLSSVGDSSLLRYCLTDNKFVVNYIEKYD